MKDKMTRGRKLKGLFSVVLVLAMVFTLMPLSPHKVHADVSPVSYCLALSDGKVYKNYVHETTVMSAPSGLSYDSTSGEWTMDNFEFAASWGQTLIFYGDIVINLIGENKLTNTLTSSNYCIYSDAAGASVKFKGTGSLVCQCGDTNGTSYAIYVREGSVIVESGVITAEAGSSATKYSYGISCKNLIVNGGTLKATASSAGTNSNGIVADNFTITAGKVEAASGNALNNESLGVFATKLDMSGGELISTGGSATTNSYGVVGGLDLSGGSIVANSGEASNSYGVYIMYNSTFTDGCLKATGEKVGIFDTYGRISVGSGIAVKVGSNAASARIKDPIASLKALLTSTENKYAEILPHTHAVGEKQEAVGGTCKTVGTIEYYKCTDSTCDAKLSSTGTVLSSIAGTKNPSNHEGIATTWGQTTTTHTEKYDCCGGAKSAAEAHSYGTTGASIYTCTVCSS